MSSLAVREASVYDVKPMARLMRREDAEELILAGWHSIEKAIRDTLKMSQSAHAVVDKDGALVAMFGVAPDAHGRGIGWAFGTHALDAHGFEFLRGTRKRFKEFYGGFKTVYNLVDIRYTRCIQWLEFLGFKQGVPMEIGSHKAVFVPMIREA